VRHHRPDTAIVSPLSATSRLSVSSVGW
jgi:hypothetical protein